MSLQDKVVVVTGASKGIGRAIALGAGQEGAFVVVNYGHHAGPAQEVVSLIGGPDRAIAVGADVSTLAGIQSLVDATVQRFGRIDILVPNAGLMPMRTVENTTEEDFDGAFNINVKGPYFLVQKSLPHIPAGGRIIFISTGVVYAAHLPAPYLLYAATKGTLEQLSRYMAKDLAKKGITVNAVAPGPIGTDLFLEGKPESMIKMLEASSPFNRLGKPEEIANVVAFLASEKASWVTGQVIRANGGMV